VVCLAPESSQPVSVGLSLQKSGRNGTADAARRRSAGPESPAVSLWLLLAAGGAVLLTSTAAAMTAEHDARPHGAPSRPGEASPATSPQGRQHPD
jgi:hypothetical protein